MQKYSLTHRLMAILFLFATFAAFTPAAAQSIYSEYDAGTISFDYLQWPFGGLEGSFLSDGPIWNDDLSFPEGQTSGSAGGISGAVGDTTQAIAIGLIDNSNGTQDVAVIFVTFPEGPAIGSYTVDTETMTAGFLWIDQVSNLTIPAEGDDYQLWFDNLQANHKFGSTSGTIQVTAVSEDGFTGTLDGMMGDPDNFTIVTISNGVFDVVDVPLSAVPQAQAPARLAAAPNPFNPQTTVKLSLDQSGAVSVNIFDLAGRRIAVLHHGLLDQGDHQWVWNGMNDVGIKQSGGVYFCRAQGNGWQTANKLVLVP